MRPLEADGRARLCGACDTPVYDKRSMTRGELHRLIEKHEGPLPCLRLRQRPDGTIVTGNCFAPVLRAGRFLWLKATMAAVAFWSAVVASRSWTPGPTPTVIDWNARAETEARKLPFVLKAVEGPEYFPPAKKPTKRPKDVRSEMWTLGKPAYIPGVDDPAAAAEDL
jgi:hypothetical protein